MDIASGSTSNKYPHLYGVGRHTTTTLYGTVSTLPRRLGRFGDAVTCGFAGALSAIKCKYGELSCPARNKWWHCGAVRRPRMLGNEPRASQQRAEILWKGCC